MCVRFWIASIAMALVPSGPAIAADLLYVSYSGDTGGVITFDVSLGSGTAISASVSTFKSIYAGEYGTIVNGLAFDSSGNLCVGISDNLTSFGVINKYNLSGVYQSFIGSNLYRPNGLVSDKIGNLYAASTMGIINDVPYGRITKYNSSGVFQGDIGNSSNVLLPKGLAIDPPGNLYAADMGNTITRFDPSGGFLGTIGDSSNLNGPNGLAIDSSGYLYAANTSGNTISRFSPSGNFLGTIGSSSNLSSPKGLAIDSTGNLYVANANNTITEFDPLGQFVLSWSTGTYSPNFLAFHPVPEPSTYVLCLISAMTLGVLARRRRLMILSSRYAAVGISRASI